MTIKLEQLLNLKIELSPPVKEIHRHPCKQCPSILDSLEGDFESLYYVKEASREEQIESVFRCAWRQEKACRGWCDRINVTEEDLKDRKL